MGMGIMAPWLHGWVDGGMYGELCSSVQPSVQPVHSKHGQTATTGLARTGQASVPEIRRLPQTRTSMSVRL